MRKLMIISFYYPPHPSIASKRIGGLSKYLAGIGWEPVIVTSKVPGRKLSDIRVVEAYYPGNVLSGAARTLGLDPVKGVQDQVGILKAIKTSRNPLIVNFRELITSLIAYPDTKKKWYTYALEAARHILKNEKIDLILSSSPPETTHLVARELLRTCDVPWVADLRDLWSRGVHFDYWFRWVTRKRDEILEKKVLSRADALVTVSGPMAKELEELHHRKDIFTITNGFDPEQISREEVLSEKFTLTHTGGIYPVKQDPVLLLKAVKDLVETGEMDPDKVDIRFWGPELPWLDKIATREGLEACVHQYGTVPREVSLTKQRESQILLHFTWNAPGCEGIYGGKIFEYLGSRRPVLSIGKSCKVVKELLETTKAGKQVTDINSLKRALLYYYHQFMKKGRVPYEGIERAIRKYGHNEMAKRFSEVFDEVLVKRVS
ncbi:MAG: glycosyltransferase [Candidatus Omnitrophica bacterium]|nr:glycosyltransferase [Candidatus Omnitrophota bacterium]